LLTREQVREIDRRAVEEYGMPSILLMENAGAGVAFWIVQLFNRSRRILIFCGPGNNGGDGYVIARHLQSMGFLDVQAIAVEPPSSKSPDAVLNYSIAQACGLVTHEIPRTLPLGSVLVDCLFGTGLTRPLAEPYISLIERINESQCDVLAVDLPSGLNCDTGKPMGACIKAKYTATFVGHKQGFSNASEWIGQVCVIGIGILVERS